MFNVPSLLIACLVYSAVVLSTNSQETPACLHENELWGSPDATKFYFCIPGTDIVVEQQCPRNKLFVKNEKMSGCVPTTLMDPKCVNLVEPGPCTGNNLSQPQPSNFPTQFYLCTAEGAAPLLLTCESGKAFVHQDGFLGCFEWAQWRNITGCPQ